MVVETTEHELDKIKRIIESDKDTHKAFKVLVTLVKQNYPWYNNPEDEVLDRMVKAGCENLKRVQDYIVHLYFLEKSAGPVFKPVRGFGGARG